MAVKAVIDIGSNSIKMRIANVINSQVKVIRDETDVVKLGRGMSNTGYLNEQSMKNSCDTVTRMVKRAMKYKAEIFIVGTMALRTAKNSHTFINMIKNSTGYDVNVFSGEDEAKYSWYGAIDGFDIDGKVLMFDSGGGSTEFVLGINGQIEKIVSVPVGAVTLLEKFFYDSNKPVKAKFCDEIVNYVKNLLLEYNIIDFISSKDEKLKIIGVGGGAVSMAGVKNACENFEPSKLHGEILTVRDVERQIKMYSSLTLKERENIIGLPPARADAILGSACIILTVLKFFAVNSFRVSINGLRHGLLIYNENEKKFER